MGIYNDYFLASLEKIETVNSERTYVELNMARLFLSAILGEEWCRRRVLFGDKPDPFMLNANDRWLATHPVPPPDTRRVLYTSRVIRLSDALFTLVGKVSGFERFRQRLLKRKDTSALFSEALVASLLTRNGAAVQIVGESGKRGEDFDLLVTIGGVPVSVEVTGLHGTTLSVRAILNKLRSKRSQVPSNRAAVLYLIAPNAWMKNYTAAFLVFNEALIRFTRASRRFNAVVLIWEGIKAAEGGGFAQSHLQPIYNNRARWVIPDRGIFNLKADNWGRYLYSDPFVEKLKTFRLKQQIGQH
ncbi:MAG: hypothetical protein WBB34_16755 [Xanthobacteraceae bacterium]